MESTKKVKIVFGFAAPLTLQPPPPLVTSGSVLGSLLLMLLLIDLPDCTVSVKFSLHLHAYDIDTLLRLLIMY